MIAVFRIKLLSYEIQKVDLLTLSQDLRWSWLDIDLEDDDKHAMKNVAPRKFLEESDGPTSNIILYDFSAFFGIQQAEIS